MELRLWFKVDESRQGRTSATVPFATRKRGCIEYSSCRQQLSSDSPKLPAWKVPHLVRAATDTVGNVVQSSAKAHHVLLRISERHF